MRFTLQRASVEDVETLLAFERRVANPRIYGPIFDRARAAEEINTSTFYFIKMGDAVIGTAAYRLRSDESMYISNVAVDPIYRHRGVARAVMTRFLEQCKEAPRVDLVTHPENEIALKLYTSLGFKVQSREENYFGDGEPRLVLVLART
jgi:[ribosomal protein S18]-alanine N-acetyltransferase